MPSGRVLPSSRDRSVPSSVLRFRIASPIRSRASARSWRLPRAHAGAAATAAAMARLACAASARAYSPTTSSRLEGFRFRLVSAPDTHSPATRLPCAVMTTSFRSGGGGAIPDMLPELYQLLISGKSRKRALEMAEWSRARSVSGKSGCGDRRGSHGGREVTTRSPSRAPQCQGRVARSNTYHNGDSESGTGPHSWWYCSHVHHRLSTGGRHG